MMKSPLLEIPTLLRFIRTITQQSGMSVVFERDIQYPFTDRKTIHIPMFNSRMSNEDLLKLRFFVLHECLHHTEGTEMFDVLYENKLDIKESPLAAMYCAIEDNRIEREGSKRYAGDAHVIDEFSGSEMEKWTREKAMHRFPAEDKTRANLGAVIAAEWTSRDWSPTVAANSEAFIESTPEHIQERTRKLLDMGFKKELDKCKDPFDTFELAKKCYEELTGKSADEHIEEQKQKAKKGKGGDEEGEGGEGKEKGEGSGSEMLKSDHRGEPSKEGQKRKYEEGSMEDELRQSLAPLTLDYTDYKASGAYTPSPELLLYNHSTGRFDGPWGKEAQRSVTGGGEGYYRNALISQVGHMRAEAGSGRGFANKVRRLLQIKSASEFRGGHKSGGLHKRNAYRAAIPTVGDGEYNARVFRRRHDSDVLDVAVTILTDFSGSMGGTKIAHACASALLLNDAISTSLHVPVEMLSFTELSSGYTTGREHSTMMTVLKNFDERLSADKIIERFGNTAGIMANNADGEAVLEAYHRLAGRKEKRKVLIVLSDGQPAGHRPGDLCEYTRQVIRTIERSKRVEIFGLGVEDDSVKHYYKNSAVIEDASELEGAVLGIIKRKIIG